MNERLRRYKLKRLAEIEGFATVQDMLQEVVTDSVCPGICIDPGCDFNTEVEPDARRAYCEACGTQTVQSALVLARLI